MNIYIVRHGLTDWNVLGKFQGSTDIELNEIGISQAEKLRERIQKINITKVYASPLKRAYQTAEIITQGRGLFIKTDDRIKEISLGVWEGKTFSEIISEYPELFEVWERGGETNGELGVTSYIEFTNRVSSVIDDIAKTENSYDNVLIVTHGAWVKALICKLLHIDLKHRHNFITENTGITHIKYNSKEDKFVVRSVNDVSHL